VADSTPNFPDLEDGEKVLSNDDELLWRQMGRHIWDLQHGKPNLDSFGPQGSDKRRPSFSRESLVSAQEARDWHSENVSRSHGVWACSVQEVDEAGARCVDDSGTPLEEGRKRAPGHSYIEYRHLVERPKRRELMARLLKAALARREIVTVDNYREPDDES
jgi:hypothetical protein